MNKNYIKFVKNIYSYCDENIGEKILFPFFMYFWPEIDCTVEKRDLAFYTSKIVSRLILKGALKEISKSFDNVYGMYEILENEPLFCSNPNFVVN